MSTDKKTRILVVFPSYPYPEHGAEQRDRAEGIRLFLRLGYEVSVVAKVRESAPAGEIKARAEQMGIRLMLVPYRFSNQSRISFIEKLRGFLGKFRNPLYFDGAAYEYAEPTMQAAVAAEIKTFKPDVLWCEYAYLWPVFHLARAAGVGIILRSHNYEAIHFLEEGGGSVFNYLRFVPKWFGERYMARTVDRLLSVAPKEAAMYQHMTHTPVRVLPDRNFSWLVELPPHEIRDHAPLHLFFMGASYNVPHNRAGLEFILKEIMPELERRAPGAFVFHATGSKVPDELRAEFDGKSRIYEGFVEDLNAFCARMDIAVMPSIMGAGQQSKIIETMCRGIPTVATPRGIAGWELYPGEHFIAAHTPTEFVDAILSLRDVEKRRVLSSRAAAQTKKIFSKATLEATVRDTIEAVLNHG